MCAARLNFLSLKSIILHIARAVKECGGKWREMTTDDKAPFEEKAAADKERFQRELAAYKAGKGAAADADSGSDDHVSSDEGGDSNSDGSAMDVEG